MFGSSYKKPLLTIAFLVLGPYFTWSGISNMLAGSRAKAWPTTTGTITVVNVTVEKGSRGRVTYQPEVKYRYGVGDRHYRSDRIDFAKHGSSSGEEVAEFVGQFEVGDEVPVRYNPKDPQSAVLLVGISNSHWFDIAFGVALTSAALFFCWSAWRDLNDNTFPTQNGF